MKSADRIFHIYEYLFRAVWNSVQMRYCVEDNSPWRLNKFQFHAILICTKSIQGIIYKPTSVRQRTFGSPILTGTIL